MRTELSDARLQLQRDLRPAVWRRAKVSARRRSDESIFKRFGINVDGAGIVRRAVLDPRYARHDESHRKIGAANRAVLDIERSDPGLDLPARLKVCSPSILR